jgi:hypothetical protein
VRDSGRGVAPLERNLCRPSAGRDVTRRVLDRQRDQRLLALAISACRGRIGQHSIRTAIERVRSERAFRERLCCIEFPACGVLLGKQQQRVGCAGRHWRARAGSESA